ncbi:MAG: hypothetical protein ABEI52_03980 [Halobacteriaceae archaeon]
MRIAKLASIVALLVAPVVLSGCSMLGLGGPPPLCEDQSVKNYVQTVNEANTNVNDAATRIGELVTRLQNDPSLVNESSWQNAMDGEVQKIMDANNQIQNLSSPRQELSVAHDMITGAFQNYSDGAQGLQQGINQGDAQRIQDAFQTIQEGDNKLSGAQDELNSVLSNCQWYQ